MIDHDLARRAVLKSLLATVAAGVATPLRASTAQDAAGLEQLERENGGRLGVFAVDVASGRTLDWRGNERFGMCSTFKLLLAAVVLREAEAGRLSLDEQIAYGREDLVPHSPVTERNADRGRMSVEALAEATQKTSDNTAANLLMKKLGGTARVTLLFRTLGDPETRIDRFEPMMNRVPAGELRDTTTPRAFAETVARLFTTDLVSLQARHRLREWMIATDTGKRRLRAGLPKEWTAGDKTGTAYTPEMPNKTNDVAIAWPPGRSAPVVIAAFYESPGYFERIRPEDEAVLADVARVAVAGLDVKA